MTTSLRFPKLLAEAVCLRDNSLDCTVYQNISSGSRLTSDPENPAVKSRSWWSSQTTIHLSASPISKSICPLFYISHFCITKLISYFCIYRQFSTRPRPWTPRLRPREPGASYWGGLGGAASLLVGGTQHFQTGC